MSRQPELEKALAQHAAEQAYQAIHETTPAFDKNTPEQPEAIALGNLRVV